MSQSLNIVINIREAGMKIVDDLIKRLRELNSVVAQTKTDPLHNIAAAASEINDKFGDAAASVKNIQKTVDHAVRSVAKQAVDQATGTFGRIERTAASMVEGIYTKMVVAGTGALLLGNTQFNNFYAKILQNSESLVGIFSTIGIGALDLFKATLEQVLGTVKAIAVTANSLGPFLGLLYRVSGFGFTFLVYKTFLHESTILLKRLIGMGPATLTPLQHASRLITTIDESVSGIQFKASSLFKTAGLGLMTMFGPFSGIIAGIPFINSVIDNALGFFRKGQLTAMSFFGSSRAQTQLIIMQLKELLELILPKIIDFLKAIGLKGTSFWDVITLGVAGHIKFHRMKKVVLGTIAEIKSAFEVFVVRVKSISLMLQQVLQQALEKPGAKKGGLFSVKEISSETVAIKELAREVVMAVGSSKVFAGSTQNIAKTAKDAAKEIDKEVVSLRHAIVELLNFEKVKDKRVFGKSSPGLSQNLMQFADLSKRILDAGKSSKEFEAQLRGVFGGLAKGIYRFSDTFGTHSNKAISAVVKNLDKAFTQNLHVDPAKVKQAFSAIDEYLATLEKRGIVKGETMGGKLVNLLANGVKGNMPEIKVAIEKLAELIAGYFPQSPARWGPLVGLVVMGSKIPFYLAAGITKSIGLVASAAVGLAGAIMRPIVAAARLMSEPLEDAAKLSHFSERVGISVEKLSALDYAMKSVDGSAQDLEFILTRVNQTLSKSFSDEEQEKIKRLGVNLGDIKRSGDPALAFFFAMSKVIKESEPNTQRYNDAIEMLGITAGSNLINVAKLGDEIQKRMIEGAEVGAVVNTKFAAMAVKILGIKRQFDLIKTRFFNVFIDEILPKIEAAGDKILKIIKDNKQTIQSFLTVAGQAVSVLVDIFAELFSMLFTKPGETWDTVEKIFLSGIKFIGDSLSTFYKSSSTAILDFVKTTGAIVIKTIGKAAKLAISTIWNVGKIEIPGLVSKIGKLLVESLTESPERARLRANSEKMAQEITLQKSALKSRGYYDLEKEYEGLQKKRNELQTKIDNETDEAFKAELSFAQILIEEQAQKIDEARTKIRESVSKGIKSGEISQVSEVLKKVGGGSELSKISESWNAALTAIGSKENLDKVRKNWEELKTNIGNSTKNEELKNLISNLLNVVSKENFDKVAQNVADVENKTKIAITNITKEVSSQRPFGQFMADLDLAKKKIKELFSINLALLKQRSKVETDTTANKEIQYQIELEEMKQRHVTEFEDYRAMLQKKYDSSADIHRRLAEYAGLQEEEQKQLQDKQNKDRAKIQGEEWLVIAQNITQATATAGQMFSDLYEMSGKKAKEFFFISKAMNIASATMNIAVAITKALAETGITGIINQSLIAAMGVVQLGKIASQTINGYASGGMVEGPGGKDSILARVTKNEYVQPVSAVEHYGAQAMEAIRQKIIPRDVFFPWLGRKPYIPPRPAFATGGMVGQPAQQTPINIVNVPDPSLVEQYLASTAGQRVLFNVLSNNRQDLRRAIEGI